MTTRIHHKLIAAGTALSGAGLLASAAVWRSVPDPMPIHWDAAGEPNGFASKAFALLFVPLLGAALAPFTGALVARTGAKHAAEKRARTGLAGGVLALLTGGFFLGIHLLTIRASLDPTMGLSMGMLMSLLGLFILGMAPTMLMLEPNRWAGFRTSWSLNDETNWTLTHRFGAWSLGIAGLVCMLAPVFFATTVATWVGFAAIMVGALLPMPYSYLLHRVRRR